MNTVSNIDMSISNVISNIEENIINYSEVIHEWSNKLKTKNLDEESKKSMQSHIEFLKFHIEQLQSIHAQLHQAKNNEVSFALSSEGQTVH